MSGIPRCFEKTDSCSSVASSERTDCYPESGANEVSCTNCGCHWCVADNKVPYCFFNSKQEAACAMRFPIQKRINCHPQPGTSRESCEAKGCFWCSTTTANILWWFYSADGSYGYTINDQPEKTDSGWRYMFSRTFNKHFSHLKFLMYACGFIWFRMTCHLQRLRSSFICHSLGTQNLHGEWKSKKCMVFASQSFVLLNHCQLIQLLKRRLHFFFFLNQLRGPCQIAGKTRYFV